MRNITRTLQEIKLRVSIADGEWHMLADLPDGAYDPDILIHLASIGEVHLCPESNQKALRPEDRAAAIRMGGQDRHMVRIDEEAAQW